MTPWRASLPSSLTLKAELPRRFCAVTRPPEKPGDQFPWSSGRPLGSDRCHKSRPHRPIAPDTSAVTPAETLLKPPMVAQPRPPGAASALFRMRREGGCGCGRADGQRAGRRGCPAQGQGQAHNGRFHVESSLGVPFVCRSRPCLDGPAHDPPQPGASGPAQAGRSRWGGACAERRGRTGLLA